VSARRLVTVIVSLIFALIILIIAIVVVVVITIIIFIFFTIGTYSEDFEQESHVIAEKPRDATAVCFGLKFADIHHKCKSSQAPKDRALDIPTQPLTQPAHLCIAR